MPQSLSRMLVHLVFSTKDRRPWLDESIRSELHAYLASAVTYGDTSSVRIGGVGDHVHIALFLGRTESIAKVVERVKVSSSKWIKTKGTAFANFEWQRGYGAFSVGLGDIDALVRYINEQPAHHERRDFQAEFRAMLIQYGVTFDERYVWD